MSLATFYASSRRTSPFGESPGYDGFHYGQDFKGPQGLPIPTPWPLTIVRSDWQSGHGNHVVGRRADGWFVSFSHMVANPGWSYGQEVGRGDDIGYVGNTGMSFGAHLHIQISRSSQPWVHGTEVDPWPQIVAALTSTAGGGSTPFTPGRKHSMTTLFHREGSNVYALAGDSPGTPANWLETSDGQFANKLAETHGNAKTLSPGTWDSWKAAYRAPVSTTGGGKVEIGEVTVKPDPELLAATNALGVRLTAIEKAIKAPRTTSVG